MFLYFSDRMLSTSVVNKKSICVWRHHGRAYKTRPVFLFQSENFVSCQSAARRFLASWENLQNNSQNRIKYPLVFFVNVSLLNEVLSNNTSHKWKICFAVVLIFASTPLDSIGLILEQRKSTVIHSRGLDGVVVLVYCSETRIYLPKNINFSTK